MTYIFFLFGRRSKALVSCLVSRLFAARVFAGRVSLSGPVEGALRHLAKRSTARPSFSGSRFRSRASCKAAGLCRQAGTYSSVRAVPDIVRAVHGLAPPNAISGSLRRCDGLWVFEAAAVTFAPGALRPRACMRQVPLGTSPAADAAGGTARVWSRQGQLGLGCSSSRSRAHSPPATCTVNAVLPHPLYA